MTFRNFVFSNKYLDSGPCKNNNKGIEEPLTLLKIDVFKLLNEFGRTERDVGDGT
jgi:hypothetical protein